MKFILTSIALCFIFIGIQAQDTIPVVQPQDTLPAVAPAQEVAPVGEPIAQPVAEPTPEQAPQAQEQVQKPVKQASWKQKMYFGGFFNFSLGSYTSVGIEPLVGYKIIPRLSVGVKIKYDYIQDKRYAETYTYSNYGGSLFTRLNVIRRLYLHAEYAGYNYERYDVLGSSERVWIPFLFVGAGFSQPLGGRASLNAQVLFDVLNNANSPYRNWEPFYSVGIGVGF